MVLWWIGNVVLLVAVLPVVIFLLNRVLAALERIRGACDNILAGGGALVGAPQRSAKLDQGARMLKPGIAAPEHLGGLAQVPQSLVTADDHATGS